MLLSGTRYLPVLHVLNGANVEGSETYDDSLVFVVTPRQSRMQCRPSEGTQ